VTIGEEVNRNHTCLDQGRGAKGSPQTSSPTTDRTWSADPGSNTDPGLRDSFVGRKTSIWARLCLSFCKSWEVIPADIRRIRAIFVVRRLATSRCIRAVAAPDEVIYDFHLGPFRMHLLRLSRAIQTTFLIVKIKLPQATLEPALMPAILLTLS